MLPEENVVEAEVKEKFKMKTIRFIHRGDLSASMRFLTALKNKNFLKKLTIN